VNGYSGNEAVGVNDAEELNNCKCIIWSTGVYVLRGNTKYRRLLYCVMPAIPDCIIKTARHNNRSDTSAPVEIPV
jgi:hypothetical protein